MQKTTVSMFLFVLLTLTLTQLAVAQWQDNIVTNQTTEDIYIVYSTLMARNSSGSIPAGHRTTGFYRIQADQHRVFRAWANNPIYFQIWKGGRVIKPLSSTQTVSAWVHPNRGFTVVTESAISVPVSTAQIRYTSRSRNELEQRDGFIRYANGARISVTSGWVPVNAPVTPPAVSVDVNGDGVVDASDVALVASRLGVTGADAADVNGDGIVDATDITLVSNAIGTIVLLPVAEEKTLPQKVFEKYSLTLQQADIQRFLPTVLEALKDPDVQNRLNPTTIEILIDNPDILRQLAPAVEEDFITLLKENAALQRMLRDADVQTLLQDPDAIAEFTALISGER